MSLLGLYSIVTCCHGTPADALRNGVKATLHRPTADDFILNDDGTPTTISQYDFTAGTRNLTADSKKALRQDLKDYQVKKDAYAAFEAALLSDHLITCGIASRNLLHADTVYVDAKLKNDIYSLMAAVESTHSQSNGATIIRHMTDFIQLRQGTRTHEEYLYDINQSIKHVIRDFEDPALKGYMKLTHFISIIYLNGVDRTAFKTQLDLVRGKYPAGKIDDYTSLF